MSIFTLTGMMSLQPDSPVKRLPPRPAEFRQPHYLDVFDSTTIFYDVFRSERDGKIIAVGPPLLNLQSTFSRTVISAAGRPCEVQQFTLDRCARWEISAESCVDSLSLDGELGSKNLEVGTQCSSLFEGHRVLLTVSKDNKIGWMQDWVQFYVREHGATAVVIYDNASTLYSLEELHEALVNVNDELTIAVVSWPFPWAPPLVSVQIGGIPSFVSSAP